MNTFLMLLLQRMDFIGATDEYLCYVGKLSALFLDALQYPSGVRDYVESNELRLCLDVNFDGSLKCEVYTDNHDTLDSRTFKPIEATAKNVALWVVSANIDPAKSPQ